MDSVQNKYKAAKSLNKMNSLKNSFVEKVESVGKAKSHPNKEATLLDQEDGRERRSTKKKFANSFTSNKSSDGDDLLSTGGGSKKGS